MPAAREEFERANSTYPKRLREWEKKHGAQKENLTQTSSKSQGQGTRTRAQKVIEPPKMAELRIQPGDDLLFLKLSAATKIYTQYEISNDDINRAEVLVCEYLLEFKQVSNSVYKTTLLTVIIQRYGIEKLKPNHHFLVHLPAQIHDYGPVYGFWCFLGERLNKLLKSFKSNNWGGGQLEISMMREWGRDVQLHEMVRSQPYFFG